MTAPGRILSSDSIQEINDLYYRMGLTDGLPIIPPTPDTVNAMVRASGRDPREVIGFVPPKQGAATIEKIATNAVMAGCMPAHLPVVIAALEACLADEFNLYGVQTTTNPVTPLLIVHGPVARELEINSGYNCLGHGVRANAAIGRAVRLSLINIGGGARRATHGQPGRYSFCFAENEEESPWPPFHVDRGFDPGASAVTVFGAGGSMNIRPYARRGRDVLAAIARMMALGGSPRHSYALVILNPEHARFIAADGFSKERARNYLFENARVRPSGFTEEVAQNWIDEPMMAYMDIRKIVGDLKADTFVPGADAPEHIFIVVAGGSGGHCVFIPCCFTQPTPVVTKPVR
ncbi:MAG: hypothetical protein HY323_15820 [Betaproteobacteria bacterium]|nr:hypothetical protein [Betaproteobacteria bacterium]MBI3938444.1 hypothetical protein [Betaproteobacteria bacterium]